MTLIEMLEALEAAPQGNVRLEKLKELDCPELRELLNLCLSPDITFGVKKLPKSQKGATPFTDEEWETMVLGACAIFKNRVLTGNAAQDHLKKIFSQCSDTQQKWAERIFKRDLRLNIDTKSVNKVLPGTIEVFVVPLAESYEKAKNFKGLWTLQPKLDGARCVACIPGKPGVPVVLKSRTGKVWENFESVRKVLQDFNDSGIVKAPMRFDGEVISRVNGAIDFQAIQHTLFDRKGGETGELQYVVFDAAPEPEWHNPEMQYVTRLDMAQGLIESLAFWAKAYTVNPEKVVAIPSEFITDPTIEQLTEACKRFVALGYEGAMIRRADKPVAMKRSKDLLKVKIFKDLEAEILGVVEGTGRLAGTLGAMVMSLLDGSDKTFECGSGFSDGQRDKYWKNPPLHDKATVKFFEFTDDGLPRFPIFRAIRHPDDM